MPGNVSTKTLCRASPMTLLSFSSDVSITDGWINTYEIYDRPPVLKLCWSAGWPYYDDQSNPVTGGSSTAPNARERVMYCLSVQQNVKMQGVYHTTDTHIGGRTGRSIVLFFMGFSLHYSGWGRSWRPFLFSIWLSHVFFSTTSSLYALYSLHGLCPSGRCCRDRHWHTSRSESAWPCNQDWPKHKPSLPLWLPLPHRPRPRLVTRQRQSPNPSNRP
jgi:hypothetical protein